MNAKPLAAALLLSALLAAALPAALADCCGSACYHLDVPAPDRHTPVKGFCNDCTEGTPYCGYGPCNIFGCNCDGGCRHSSDGSIPKYCTTPDGRRWRRDDGSQPLVTCLF